VIDVVSVTLPAFREKPVKELFLIVMLSMFLAEIAGAHSGRTNSSGCHNNRKTGGYHCHGGGAGYRATKRKIHSPLSSDEPVINSGVAADRNLILEVQRHLNRFGYAAGAEDGVVGKKTTESIRRFQRDNNI
jgi:hypothetical protein